MRLQLRLLPRVAAAARDPLPPEDETPLPALLNAPAAISPAVGIEAD